MMTFEGMDKQYASMQEQGIFHLLQDGEAYKVRNALCDEIERNPIFEHYVQHISRGTGTALNTEPWHAMGERLSASWQVLAASVPNSGIRIDGFPPELPREPMLVSMAVMIAGAPPYLWSDKMEKLADAAPLPKHVVSKNVMPAPVMFWSRESKYVQTSKDGTYEGENNWIALFYTPHGILVIGDWFNDKEGEMRLLRFVVPFGLTWPHDYPEPDAREVGIVLKRCAFLNSPFIVHGGRRLAHHHRRQMEKAGVRSQERDEEVHVVTLRRLEKQAATQPKPNETGVEWKHHWWVAAHYRAQWYASEQAHRVIWIDTHLKGDLNMPLLEKVYAVVR